MGAPGERRTTSIGEGSIVADKYRIERVIGEGGMGIVFAAVHLELEHRVALKIVREELAEHEEAVERMLREARNSARLRSEHVARVLDVSRLASGAPYIVMEHLEGEDLATCLRRRGRLLPGEAVVYLLQICEAMAEAHAAGIVHRDLKPENLFLTTRADGAEIVKVLDFGVSKHLTGDPEARLTNPRKVLGSPDYMAPEQMRANATNDVRADIWSLGAVLYELLTGLRPFEAPSIASICARVLDEEPAPPRSVVGTLPAGLEAVVLQCLRKDPATRYASVVDLAAALAPFGPPEAAALADRVRRVASRAGAPERSPTSLEPMTADALATRASLAHAVTEPVRSHRRRRHLAIAAALALAGASLLAFRAQAPAVSVRLERLAISRALPSLEVALPEVSEVEPSEDDAMDDAVSDASEERVDDEAAVTAPSSAAMQATATPRVAVTSAPPTAEDEAVDAWDPSAFGGRR